MIIYYKTGLTSVPGAVKLLYTGYNDNDNDKEVSI